MSKSSARKKVAEAANQEFGLNYSTGFLWTTNTVARLGEEGF